MPQKLIRLTSETGDGIFNGIFNEEIEIKQDSEIALQSLSVERKSQAVVINSSNGALSFSSVSATGTPFAPNQTGAVIPHGLYDKSNYEELLDNIGAAMNRVCSLFTDIGQWGIQHVARINSAGQVGIGARISPFYQVQNPTLPDFVINNRPVINNVIDSELLNMWEQIPSETAYGMWRATDTTTGGGGSEPLITESYVFGTEPLTKSTGVFRTRFKRLNTNGAGTPSFTMGVVKGADGLTKLQNSTFTLADCVYAIRANGHNAAMKYLREKGGAWIDTVTPVNHTTADWTDNLNDVIDISFANGGILGKIYQQVTPQPAAGVVTTLNNAIGHDDTADYYWFISMHEGKNNCVLDLTGVTLDPWWNIGNDLPTSIRTENIVPGFIENSEIDEVPQYDSNGVDKPFTPSVQLTDTFAKYLGFNNGYLSPVQILPAVEVIYKDFPIDDPTSETEFNQRLGYIYTADNLFDNSYDSDTYIIDTQTFTLDSYDSYGLSTQLRNSNSGGSRRNIIATIPITEVPIAGSSNSIIQYEPATQNYIKIKNRGDIVTRQIRCRLLSGMYQPVKTEGLASIVLLIKE
jgi:hypothetical protein